VFTFGRNNFGQLGRLPVVSLVMFSTETPLKFGPAASEAVFCATPTAIEHELLRGKEIVDIACGSEHTIALLGKSLSDSVVLSAIKLLLTASIEERERWLRGDGMNTEI
jgi:alpha-tubulin suppressor-like RCC1 family protein